MSDIRMSESKGNEAEMTGTKLDEAGQNEVTMNDAARNQAELNETKNNDAAWNQTELNATRNNDTKMNEIGSDHTNLHLSKLKPNEDELKTTQHGQARLPFMDEEVSSVYPSLVFPGLTLEQKEDHLLLAFPGEVDGLSSAVYGGGMVRLTRAVNLFVSRDYECSDPVRDMKNKLLEWGYPAAGCAGLMTAVPLEHAAVAEEDTGSAGIFCCVTAAAGNAARAGVERPVLKAYRPGTINIMLGIDGRLSPAAMVNAVMTAVEAKAAALADLGITDPENGLTATGTTTDAIVLGVSQNGRYGAEHVYAGTATDLGGAIGRLVYGAVTASLQSVQAHKDSQ
jgi:adenosylcobinamide hydrolase